MSVEARVEAPTFRAAFLFWLKLGFINFGGPTGQIALMHKEIVERRRWISEERFLHALNYCMLLPGPEAMQLAIYVGWLLHRTAGGVVAGVLFMLPSVGVLLVLSWLYVTLGTAPLVAGAFLGLKAVVVAIVAHAVLRIARRTLRAPALWTIAAAALGALYFLDAPFPWVILAAAGVGLVGARAAPRWFAANVPAGSGGASVLGNEDAPPPHALPDARRAATWVLVGAALLLLPLAGLAFALGFEHPLVQVGLFFAAASFVTFGGAYAVLGYVAQRAVQTFGWLTAAQMVDGLGLAETTPGPLIMVVCFVGFLAGWTTLHSLGGAVAGGLLATYVTLLPSFVFIFLGAPYIERLRGNRTLAGALTAITAAVVGVVLNLAIFLALRVLFPAGSVEWFAVALAAGAFVILWRTRADVVVVITAGAALGLAYRFFVP